MTPLDPEALNAWKIVSGYRRGVFIVSRPVGSCFVEYLNRRGRISRNPSRYRSKESATAAVEAYLKETERKK